MHKQIQLEESHCTAWESQAHSSAPACLDGGGRCGAHCQNWTWSHMCLRLSIYIVEKPMEYRKLIHITWTPEDKVIAKILEYGLKFIFTHHLKKNFFVWILQVQIYIVEFCVKLCVFRYLISAHCEIFLPLSCTCVRRLVFEVNGWKKNYFCHFPHFNKGYNYSLPYFHLKYKKAKKSVLKKSEKPAHHILYVHTVLHKHL